MRGKPLTVLLASVLLSGLAVSATAVGGQQASTSRAVVKTAFNKTLKRAIVVDGRGLTLYLFTQDTGVTSACAKDPDCLKVWPALTSTGKPVAGKGINARLLGTTKGAGGRRQITYNRHPLYYFRGGVVGPGDKKPGDVLGQGFFQQWYVLSPKGTPIRK